MATKEIPIVVADPQSGIFISVGKAYTREMPDGSTVGWVDVDSVEISQLLGVRDISGVNLLIQ